MQAAGTRHADLNRLLMAAPGGFGFVSALAVNDRYFVGMLPALSAVGVEPVGQLSNVSAGDGSQGAYQRVCTGQYQDATIPGPVNLQGWQLIHELNRAFAGQKPRRSPARSGERIPEAALSGGPDGRQRSGEAVPPPLDLLVLGTAVAQGPGHPHPNTSETFIVLEGVLTLDFRDGSSARLRPGMSLCVPAGVSHRSRCELPTGGRALSVSLEVQDQQVVLEPEDL